MKFRKAEVRDINKIQKLIAEGLEIKVQIAREFYTREKLIALVKSKLSFVFTDNKKIIGAVAGYPDREQKIVAWCDLLVVDPTIQGRGVGAKIMNFFENKLKLKGFGQILLYTETTNPEAMKFYEKIGYKKVGRLDFLKPFVRIFYKKVINPKMIAQESKKIKSLL